MRATFSLGAPVRGAGCGMRVGGWGWGGQEAEVDPGLRRRLREAERAVAHVAQVALDPSPPPPRIESACIESA